jgi:hypothetical protein
LITFSARISTTGGIVKPRAWAVLRLITSGFRRRGRDEYVNFETDPLIGEGGEPVKLTFRGSILDSYVLALDIAELTERSRE